MTHDDSSESRALTQLTLRGFDPELERRLRALAREHSTSLNRAALVLMRRGAGLATPSERAAVEPAPIGAALDSFIGVWSKDDEEEFLRSIEEVEAIDSELWE